MKYKLIIRTEAATEIIDIVKYYESQQKGLGKRFLTHLEKYLIRIQTYPEHFPVKRSPYREAFIRKFPYLIIYEFLNNTIVIYAVFNTRQNPIKKP